MTAQNTNGASVTLIPKPLSMTCTNAFQHLYNQFITVSRNNLRESSTEAGL
jgi:hypothetical protein